MDDPELALENAIEHLQAESPEPLGMKSGRFAVLGNVNCSQHLGHFNPSADRATIMRAHTLDTGPLFSSREEAFFKYVRERLLAVARDRDVMTRKVRNLLREHGRSYDEIMSAEWYNLSEVESSLSFQFNGGTHPPSSIHPLSQASYSRKLWSPCGSLKPPVQEETIGYSKYQPRVCGPSDSGVCLDTWVAYDIPTSARTKRLCTYVHQQNMVASCLSERERSAQAAAISFMSNLPQNEDLNPDPCGSNLCQRDISWQDNTKKLAESTRQQDFNAILSPNHRHSPSHLVRWQHLPKSDLPRSRSVTLFVYTLNELPVPYAKRLSGMNFTLKDFKDKVFGRTGEYRYFFKSFFPDVNLEMFEEFSDEEMPLPVCGGKVEARVERV